MDELVNCAEGALLESSEVAGTSGPPSRRFLGEETMSNLLRYARSVLVVIGNPDVVKVSIAVLFISVGLFMLTTLF